MQLHFRAISEPGKPGRKWQKFFNTYWPAYRTWLESKGKAYAPDLQVCEAALKKYMPEMWPTYKRLCKLAKADEVAARFLTGYQPPAYISACSQAVINKDVIQLVRNYDYHPDLSEGTQFLSSWNGKKVIATSDCLIGAVDGMNEDGLAISLTFGGRKAVGKGFGIPFILRYVLEFCSNTDEAVAALTRIPSHMSYNVTVVDKSGSYKTLRLAPDRAPVVTDAAFTTNHQGTVDWPENAAFNKTVERADFLKKILSRKGIDTATVANAFLQPPLYNTLFKEGFGTLYTAVYLPEEGIVQLRWPKDYLVQSFDDFQEKSLLIDFTQPVATPASEVVWDEVSSETSREASSLYRKEKASQVNWQEDLIEILVDTMARVNPSSDKKQLESLREKLLNRGEISWEIVADYWANIGTTSWTNWRN